MLIKKKIKGAVTGPSVLLLQHTILVKLNVDDLSGGTKQDLLPMKFTSFVVNGILQAAVLMIVLPQALLHSFQVGSGIIVQGVVSSGIRSVPQ